MDEAINCFDSFDLTFSTSYPYGEWSQRVIPGTKFTLCLPPESVFEHSDIKESELFEKGSIGIVVPAPGTQFWSTDKRLAPHFDMILRKSKKNAADNLRQWIEENFSKASEANQSVAFQNHCKKYEHYEPHYIRYFMDFEISRDGSGEFVEFHSCNDQKYWFAIRQGKDIYLLERDLGFVLEGQNKELLLNVLRSFKAI